jgi:hypothetical protein
MFPSGSDQNIAAAASSKKLRSACNLCHQTKVKCSGGRPCDGCRSLGIDCLVVLSKQIGRPKGTRNRATMDLFTRYQASNKETRSSQQTSESLQIQMNEVMYCSSSNPTTATTSSHNSRIRSQTTNNNSTNGSLPGRSEQLSLLATADDFWSSLATLENTPGTGSLAEAPQSKV